MSDTLNASITIQPTVAIGQVTTIAEKVLEALFAGYSTILESENPVHDKKQFFRLRAATVRILIAPIKYTRETKEPMSLRFEFSIDTGIMKMSSSVSQPKKS